MRIKEALLATSAAVPWEKALAPLEQVTGETPDISEYLDFGFRKMFFSGDKRAEVTGANPEARVSEIAKILGGMWREMDDDARASYQEDADNDKGKRESGGDCSWRPVP